MWSARHWLATVWRTCSKARSQQQCVRKRRGSFGEASSSCLRRTRSEREKIKSASQNKASSRMSELFVHFAQAHMDWQLNRKWPRAFESLFCQICCYTLLLHVVVPAHTLLLRIGLWFKNMKIIDPRMTRVRNEGRMLALVIVWECQYSWLICVILAVNNDFRGTWQI